MSTFPAFNADRKELTSRGEIVNLEVAFADAEGVAIDPDETPQIEIRQPSSNNGSGAGAIVKPLSNIGVETVLDGLGNVIPGRFKFSFQTPLNTNLGLWRDRWVVDIGDTQISQEFTFQVISGGSASIPAEEIEHTLGDRPAFDFNQAEIKNINFLLETLRATLKNNGVKEVVDPLTGDISLVPCPVFTDTELIHFLCNSLSEFNSRPHVTFLSFGDQRIADLWKYILVEGSHLMALGAQWLIEAGREFNVNDNGVSFQPPPLSTAISSQYSVRYTQYKQDLDLIKKNLKPDPRGLGTFRVIGLSPQFLRLRHLRQRQII